MCSTELAASEERHKPAASREVKGVPAPQRSNPTAGRSQHFGVVEEPSTETKTAKCPDGSSPRATCMPRTSELRSRAGLALPSGPPSAAGRRRQHSQHHQKEGEPGARERSMQYRGIKRVFCPDSLGQHRGLSPLAPHTTAALGRFVIEKIPRGYFILICFLFCFSPSPRCPGKKLLEECQLLPVTASQQHRFG